MLRRYALLASLVALLLHAVAPLALASAMPDPGEAIVICTPDGFKIVRLDARGVPVAPATPDEAPSRTHHCGHCTAGAFGAALAPPAPAVLAPAFGHTPAPVLRHTDPPHRAVAAGYRTRAPPASV